MKKMFFISVFLFTIFILDSCKVYKPYTQEMKDNLKRMYKEDQEIQKVVYDRSNQRIKDSINNRREEIFMNNYKTVLNYFNQSGFPGIKENDATTSFNFWLITQHCDNDVNFQARVLKELKVQLKKKNVNPRNYAYLYDRVMKNKGKKQLYGTQMEMKIDSITKKQKLYPIENENELNVRRKSMGLEPIEEYLKAFGY
jgi:hypothetical protein